jgi:NAD(P)-dependent dehydrogenase (short-subunit alcohol dehydrogenase family)
MSPAIPRAALVTGGARRIGRALVETLAADGFAVAIHCQSSVDEAETLAAGIVARGGRACVLRADLGREDEVARLVPDAQARLGTLGVLVNNASVFERDDALGATRASWDRHFEANLRAPFVLAQAFAQHLAEPAEGLVVNLLDQRVWSLTPHFMSYTLSKAGLWTLTQTLALGLAPRIRVCGIGPGPALANIRQSAEQFARQAAEVPLGRGPALEEFAAALRFLIAARSYTGQMLALDGGQHLNWSPSPPGAEPEE